MNSPSPEDPGAHATDGEGVRGVSEDGAQEEPAGGNGIVAERADNGAAVDFATTTAVSEGPAVAGLRARVRLAGLPGEAREAVGAMLRLGRDPACEIAFDSATYPEVSGVHATIETRVDGIVMIPGDEASETVLNGVPLKGVAHVKSGDQIQLGRSGPIVELVSIEAGDLPPVPAGPGHEQTVWADVRHRALLRGSERVERREVGAGGVIGREAGSVEFFLDHPHVSRRHASLAVDGRRVVITDLGSSNGTFINGRRLTEPKSLIPGDRIDIGPFSIQFDGNALVSRSRSNNIELAANGLKRVVQDRTTGKPLALLDDVSLVIRPKEFVCLLGPSGSGKSTLLAILSGRNSPTEGTVTVNGEDLYADFEALKGDIAVVPQRDVLHDSLGVAAGLRYTAELRLPPDLNHDELEASVADILEVVGLAKRRGTLIRHLSGGQVKRASLANELVARPSLLFLDEVTSGLDEQTDREVMELFRQVADGGKTVVCITHSLANVEATCHLVVILTEGGRLAFFGTPEEAKGYFGIARLGDVYLKLAERPAADWHDRYRASPFYEHYVASRMPAKAAIGRAERPQVPRPKVRRTSGLRQGWVLTRRYVAIWRGDRQALLALFGQSLLVAVLLGMVFGKLADVSNPIERVPRTINLMLLLGVSCFWFGCNTAAKELVKERIIFQRERDYNLRIAGYLISKLFVLTAIALAQASLLYAIVRPWTEPPGDMTSQWLILAALAVAGTSVGLLISAISRTEEVATALVPIAVIPQIILAGVIAPLKGTALAIAKGLVSVYWGQQAIERLIPKDDLRLIGRSVGDWHYPFEIVVLHAVAAAFATMVILKLRKH